jgi:hypothetical protein
MIASYLPPFLRAFSLQLVPDPTEQEDWTLFKLGVVGDLQFSAEVGRRERR